MTAKIIKIAAVAIVCSAIGISYSALRAQEAASTPRSVWDGIYTKEQAARGKTLYDQNCARCHGATLGGDDEAPALEGPEFLADWNGLTVGDLFTRIHNTMPMDNPGSLSPEVTTDILADLLSANSFPVGTTELAARPEILTQIHIDPSKPAKGN